jgi:uncharacterized membrane protein YphA (DoxX/SURF4 family)
VSGRICTADLLIPIGRALFAGIFILASKGHFAPDMIRQAADHGVPFARLVVPASGVLALVGGLNCGQREPVDDDG